ncbi:DUF262 domain-containing protein [Treponema sp.]|uniref:GmrSD restriction endonuclease domain-containing protein n=1 Tax=Treponema sp. TaxID=166 RepID=UPI00388FD5B7
MSDKQFEHLSFVDIFNSEKKDGLNLFVEIPMLQRDYAYGRESEDEKRKAFLKSMKNYLDSNNTNHELDFVYGSRNFRKNKEYLTILDGQQRITTLFLLYWYLARISGQYDSFKNLMLDEDENSKFSYATRDSSTAFCNAIVKNGDSGNLQITESSSDKKESSLSKTIVDEKWFFNHWKNDPTVFNMLNMLDAIEEIFPIDESKAYYNKLNQHAEKASITFNFLPFDDFGLTDELYIKMNSRGKPLTRFENLKSKILKEFDNLKDTEIYKEKLKKIQKNPDYKHFKSIREYVSLMFDTKWTDIFWNFWLETKKTKDKPCIDEMMLSYIINFCITNEILRIADNSFSIIRDSEEHKEIEKLMKYKNKIPYEYLLLMLIVDKNCHTLLDSISDKQRNEIYNNAKNNKSYNSLLFDLIDAFDLISSKTNKWELKSYTNNTLYNEKDIFSKVVYDYSSNGRNYEEKAFFFIYYLYISKNENINQQLFDDWLRFAYNMIKNSYQLTNGPFNYGTCLIALNYLYDTNIYNKLQNINTSNLVTLDAYQLQEEILKSHLFKNEDWKKSIIKAEDALCYFEGQLYYTLIDFCKITKGDINNPDAISTFNSAVSIMHSIFTSKKGCPENISKALIVALLSIDDYLKNKRKNWSLLKNDDRDISWRRMMKKQDDDDRNTLFSSILSKEDFNISNPIKSLKEIGAANSNNINDLWRKAIVNTPQVLDVLGPDHFLRWNWANYNHENNPDISNDNFEIDLLPGSKIYGYHYELFSYALYLNIKKKDFSPFTITYEQTATEEEQPKIKLYDYILDKESYCIYIIYADNDKFRILFQNRPKNQALPISNNKILSVLNTQQFTKENNSYIKLVKTNDVLSNITMICEQIEA